MFNHSAGGPRPSDNNEDPSYGFADQGWHRFTMNNNNTNSFSAGNSQSYHDAGASYGDSSGMDWAPTPSAEYDMRFDQHDHMSQDVELDNMSSSHGGGGGVGRLVAHFENKSFAPPLPPRPSNVVTSPVHQEPPVSSPFGNFSVTSPIVTSPLASPAEPNYGLLSGHSRVTSPIISPPPALAFGGFHDIPVHSPGVGSSSGPFGNMNSFMVNNNRVTTPMETASMAGPSMMPNSGMNAKVTSPGSITPGVPGTPGFAIWRPPVPTTSKPSLDQPQGSSISSNSGYFAKPPIPSTPKPVMNAGSQLVLDFNTNSTLNAKGKAPAKPPVKPPRPVRQPSRSSMSTPGPFSPPIKREPSTPQLSQASASSMLPPNERRTSVSQRSQVGSRPSREQVPAEAWESFKHTIRKLYLEERKPLKEVMSVMADQYGFQATPKMYKTRFSQWGFVKNNTEEEVKRLLSMKFQRDAEGKVSEFVRNGKVVNLGTYLKRKGVTEYDLVDFELPADLPAHIRCRTPTPPPAPGYLQSPDLLRAQEIIISNMRKAFLQCRQFEVETDAQVGWQTIMVWGAGSSDLLLEANHYFEMKDHDQGGHFLMKAFQQLESDLKKLSPQGIKELLLGMVHRDPGMMTALCKYLAAYSTTNFERSHPLRQIFSCLYEVQQKHGPGTLSELLWGSIPTIAEELEAIYGRKHPYVARTWVDLAMFYNHVNQERLEKLVGELRLLQRQMEQRLGPESVDVLVLRYTIVQLMFAAHPQSDATKQATIDLWHHMRGMGLLFPIRSQQPNMFCYHSPVKVDPWTKRCRRRYDSGVQFLEEHVGVRVVVYFEEDFHTTEHAPEHIPHQQHQRQHQQSHQYQHRQSQQQQRPQQLQAQDSWAAAMEQHMSSSKYSFI
ncbi:hypothetical protein BFJ63_vAg16245 [Fusarium oxysporum f. sp. narcissi]|nr:hypothetical protein FOWG_12468 [Fusarium oxysporum f. sp. lycopersici MN25]KAJ4166367.1 hypothetical protein NW765_007605 [Fusarium oxysporum]RKK25015.1 hypothetical protein BFJ65_g2933 [Fusarium oxysporum f. sp. cepae]RYC80868.1 hypothetical protein BFJ63_vAg16245 [Fusarium oxysporum f. sp. narcissi]KAJ4277403.1 hypothetical protein NW764_008649 [Fusarium oxysporum]